MIAWELIGSAPVPGAGEEMRLYRRGGEFSIRVAAGELMNSRAHGSEDALAELACDRVAGRPGVRVLVGGLGMGFTLAALLRRIAASGRVVVAELVPEVVAWNRGPLAPLAGRPLDDPRVRVRTADVAAVIAEKRGGWDALLLDVDNGPQGLSRQANDRIYAPAGLAEARAALRPGGVLAVWSAGPDPAFTRRLRRAGFDVRVVPVRARAGGAGGRRIIWLAAAAS